MRLIANLSMMFTEQPMVDRFAAARRAGFDAVEIQFPELEETGTLARAAMDQKMPVALINVPRGPGDAVGLAALPEAREAYRAAVAQCAMQAQTLEVCKVNVLAGRPDAGADPAACQAALVDNLRHTANVMQRHGIKVMVEPVNRLDVPGFFLSGLDAGLDLLAEVDHSNLFLQFDFYHMAITEPDLPAAIRRAGARIGHVQFADTPGRHEPGTGTIDFAAAFAALRETGYDGSVSAEYTPAGQTEEGLGWMDDMKGYLR